MAFLKVVGGIFLGLLAVVLALKMLGIAFFLMSILLGLLKLAIVIGVVSIVFYAVYKLVSNQGERAA